MDNCFCTFAVAGNNASQKRQLPVGPGAVFFIPPGTKHSFLEHSPRLAICLVADLSGTGPKQFGTASGWLPAEELARVRERINKLSHETPEKQFSPGSLELGAGGDTLLLLESCRRACMTLSPAASEGSAISKRLIRAIDPGGLPPMPGELARRVGLQQDHLNRLVRRSTGLTLGQWRDRELLKATEKILSQGGRIQAAAMRLGFSDGKLFLKMVSPSDRNDAPFLANTAPARYAGDQPRRFTRDSLTGRFSGKRQFKQCFPSASVLLSLIHAILHKTEKNALDHDRLAD